MKHVGLRSDPKDIVSQDQLPPQRTWQNVTASRALNTTYTNTSGHDLELNVIAYMASANTAIYATINSVTLYGSFVYAANNYSMLAVTVPPDATYLVAGTVATPSNLEWKELRP